MSLTRKLLKELELNDTAVEKIIAAHVDTVDALRQERDAALAQCESHQAETAAVREELNAYRTDVAQARQLDARRAALTEALVAQGANAQALPLLLDAIQLPEDAWLGEALQDAQAALQAYRAKYPGLFATRSPIPVTRVSPPLAGGGALTQADVKRMSVSDINRNWSAVQKALKGNA